MRIDSVTPWTDVHSIENEFAEGARKLDVTTGVEGEKADCAEFSSAATFAASLLQHPLADSDVRENTVNRLQQAIQAGTYSVSSENIAKAMLTDLQGWLRK